MLACLMILPTTVSSSITNIVVVVGTAQDVPCSQFMQAACMSRYAMLFSPTLSTMLSTCA